MPSSTQQPHFQLLKSSGKELEKTAWDPSAAAAVAAKSPDCTFIHPARLALDCNRPSSQLAPQWSNATSARGSFATHPKTRFSPGTGDVTCNTQGKNIQML